MSLLSWLGKETPKVDGRSLSPLLTHRTVNRVVLGVLGTRSNMRYEELEEQIMNPLIEAWGIPDEIIAPADGDSTQAIQSWATRKEVPMRLVTCDWVKHGRRAGILRDSCIQREATHLVLLQGPRSNTLSQLASRLARKGRPIVLSERPNEPVKSVST